MGVNGLFWEVIHYQVAISTRLNLLHPERIYILFIQKVLAHRVFLLVNGMVLSGVVWMILLDQVQAQYRLLKLLFMKVSLL